MGDICDAGRKRRPFCRSTRLPGRYGSILDGLLGTGPLRSEQPTPAGRVASGAPCGHAYPDHTRMG